MVSPYAPLSPPAISECSGQGTYCGGASNRALPKGPWKYGVRGLCRSAPAVIYTRSCSLFSRLGTGSTLFVAGFFPTLGIAIFLPERWGGFSTLPFPNLPPGSLQQSEKLQSGR